MHSKRGKVSPPPSPLAPLSRIRSHGAGFNPRCLHPPSSASVRESQRSALAGSVAAQRVLSAVEGCILSPVEGCILSPVEGCILSPVEGPIRGEPEGCPRGKPRFPLAKRRDSDAKQTQHPSPLAPLSRIRSYAAGFNLRCLHPSSSSSVAGSVGAQPMRGEPEGCPLRNPLSLLGVGAQQRGSDAQQAWQVKQTSREATRPRPSR